MSLLQTVRRRLLRPLFFWPVLALVLETAAKRSSVRTPWWTLLPLLPMLLFLVALAQTIRRMDELQQKISVVSMSIAFVLSLFLALIFVGLHRAGLCQPQWDDFGTYMLALWACCYAALAWRYR
jgi:hypothetical protein